MKKNLPKTKRRGKRNTGCHTSCFNEGSDGKCVAVRGSGILQVCHFEASPWHGPKLLASCLWWSAQLQSLPRARQLLDPVQCFFVMKIKINSPCSFRVCVCNQWNWTGAASLGCLCLSPCLLSWLHLTSTQSSSLRAREAAVHHQLLHISFWKMENVYLHNISWLCWSLGRAECEGEPVHPRWIGKQRCCDGLLSALLPCFSVWGVSGRIIWLCWLEGSWWHCGTSWFTVWPQREVPRPLRKLPLKGCGYTGLLLLFTSFVFASFVLALRHTKQTDFR